MFMGALLLLAAALTWGIGLMMSPHGESVARGTEYLRTTVVTFKRNGATGTLILCAIAAWLLFPKRRPKWPMRDWALIVLFAFLAGSSIYTLIWLPPAGPNSGGVDDSFAAAGMNLNWNASTPASDMGPTTVNSAPRSNQSDLRRRRTAPEANDRLRVDIHTESEPNVTEEPADVEGNAASYDGLEPPDNEIDENQE
jgi:hypothetical protein